MMRYRERAALARAEIWTEAALAVLDTMDDQTPSDDTLADLHTRLRQLKTVTDEYTDGDTDTALRFQDLYDNAGLAQRLASRITPGDTQESRTRSERHAHRTEQTLKDIRGKIQSRHDALTDD